MQPLTEERVSPTLITREGAFTLAILGIGLLALILIFLPEAQAAVSTWNTSTAYGHCYLVLPMALYLVWDRRQVLYAVPMRAEPTLAFLVIPVVVAWLLAERLGIMEGRQLMAVAGFEILLLSALGRRLFKALLGPLLYLLFLVPFGAFLTPALQQFTAHFTQVGLNLLGIPNFADDLIIEIPAGTFFVAEACAGLRFLIAAIAFGVFYALLNYRSPARRAAFIAASIVVPIVANGFRALGIVVLGHLLGSAEAAAADHVIYGWVFFSIVMLLLVAAGMPLREEPVGRTPLAVGVAPETGPAPMWSAVAVVAAAALGPLIATVLNSRAVAAPLTSQPTLQLPAGCLVDGQLASRDTRSSRTVRCDGFVLEVGVESFPARATSSSLLAERRHATGELLAEDTSVHPLVSGGSQGTWTLVQTQDPFRTTALASWARGAPAIGGLSGRVAQARDSLFGADHMAVLMTIGASQPGRPSPEQQRGLARAIEKLVTAQTGLDAQIEAASRTR